jgi:hypothetical protein
VIEENTELLPLEPLDAPAPTVTVIGDPVLTAKPEAVSKPPAPPPPVVLVPVVIKPPEPPPATTRYSTVVGGTAGATGLTELDAADAVDVPFALVAVTVNV